MEQAATNLLKIKSDDTLEEGDEDQLQDILARLQAKEYEFEELKRQQRLQEHQFKKKEIELQNELSYEQKRVEELEKRVKDADKVKDLRQLAENLEQKLTECETQLLAAREREHKALREVMQLESENSELKQEIKHLEKEKRIQSVQQGHSPYKSELQVLPAAQTHNGEAEDGSQSPSKQKKKSFNPIQEDQYEDIDKNELMQTLLHLQKDKEELELQIHKIKEGAIDTIVEKEKTIQELQMQLEITQQQIEQFAESQNQLQQSNNSIEVERLVMEFESYKYETEIEKASLEEQLQLLVQKYTQEKQESDEKIYRLEREMNDRHYETLQHEMDTVKNVESTLLQQLREAEEKYIAQERLYQEAVRTQESLRDEKQREVQKFERRLEELQKRIEQHEETKLANRNLQKQIEEAEKRSQARLQERDLERVKLQQRCENQMRNILNLETDNRQLQESIDVYKQRNTEVEEKLASLSQEYEHKIEQIRQQSQSEISTLQKDLKRIEHDGGESNLKNELEALEGSTPGRKERDNFDSVSAFNASSGSTTSENFMENSTSYSAQSVTQQTVIAAATSSSGNKKAANNQSFDIETSLRSPRSKIKLMFNDYQKELRKLREQYRNLEDKYDELQCDYKELTVRNDKLVQGQLQQQQEIEKLQEELKDYYKERQLNRKSALINGGNLLPSSSSSPARGKPGTDLNEQLEFYQNHLKKMETHLLTIKLQSVEENTFLKEELARERANVLQLTERANQAEKDRNYYKQRSRKNGHATGAQANVASSSSSAAAVKTRTKEESFLKKLNLF